MTQNDFDPTFRKSRREAVLILCIFLAALAYTTTYCYMFGYERNVATIRTYWGIPDWVWWGVFAPWGCCTVLTAWLSLFQLAEKDSDETGSPSHGGGDARAAGRNVSDDS